MHADFPDEMNMHPLSDLASSLYRATVDDSESECSTESDELDSDSGYGISGGHGTSCRCAGGPSSIVAPETRQLPVYLDDCTSIPLSPTERLVLVPRQWPPTSVSCSYSAVGSEVVDARQMASTSTTTQRRRDDTRTVTVGIDTAVDGRQKTTQPSVGQVSSNNNAIGVGGGGGARGARAPQIREKYFSGKYQAKFGYFANFSYT